MTRVEFADHALMTMQSPFRLSSNDKRAAALDPGFGLVLVGEGPAHEALHLVVAVDREAVVAAIDLADQNARPVAEFQVGEGGLDHQVTDREPERRGRIRGLEDTQCLLSHRPTLVTPAAEKPSDLVAAMEPGGFKGVVPRRTVAHFVR